jgi:glycosyltransferase involved in cell wall biosynthesis/MoaA/NifB/PqqE/SkfB family radical SAM enzyme
MKILKVIHGYPMRYNAGSEVYSQMLCQGLAERHEVHVFSRFEDPFSHEFSMRTEVDPDDPRITLHLVNVARSKDRYRVDEIDGHFDGLLEKLCPDIVHIGHLNHLSTSLVAKASDRGIPIVYTLHDFWLMCPRGQFMQMFPEDSHNIWSVCNGQEDRKCAERCYARYFSGDPDEWSADVDYWTHWVSKRMAHVREMVERIDLFIAPARYLYDRYHQQFDIPEHKLLYLDYGFSLERLKGRQRSPGEPFTFGYIGTHIPAKGIHLLLEAFGKLHGSPQLRIWGRPRGQDTDALKELASDLPQNASNRVEWLPEYRNQQIVVDVFNRVDAIVVPSIWAENSPLVIHEALQVRVPVITANVGGMAEYIQHEINGLSFEHRNPISLAQQMQRFVDDPELAQRLGDRGYVQTSSGDVPEMTHQVVDIEAIYTKLLQRRGRSQVQHATGPWRITFDTNPQTCNLSCIMCEGHSPYLSPMSGEQNRQQMPKSLMQRVINEAAPHGLREIIPSTMGEPLLYTHFDEILDLCRTYGIKLNLTTNGTFPGRGAKSWAECIVPLASDVKISINGATARTQEEIMVGSRWDVLLENIRTFVAVRDAHAAASGNRCQITFQVTFMEKNIAELPDLVRLAIVLGADRVKGHHLWTHYEQIEEESMRRNAASIQRWNHCVALMRAAAEEKLLPNGKSIRLDNVFMLESEAAADLSPGDPCPFLGQEVWVSAEGRFDPCCAPDQQRRKLGTFGHLETSGLMEIWRGSHYRSLLNSYRSRHLCLRCNMRRPLEVQA